MKHHVAIQAVLEADAIGAAIAPVLAKEGLAGARLTRTAVAVSLVLGCAAPPSIFAQTANAETQKAEEVVVTGSRIRGAEAVGSNVIGIGSKEITQTGLVTSTELLRSIPQVSNLGADDSRTGGPQRAVANVVAGSSVNLRGLGVEATLALVDGRRPMRNNEGRSFEMNNIPSIVLQRVEVVPDGASAIYGSDAVTGVVNLVPYHSYEGATVRANYGSADNTHQYTFSALGGHSWDTGNVVVAYEHYKRAMLLATDRSDLYNDSVSTGGTIGTTTSAFPGNIQVGAGPTASFRPILDSNSDGRLSLAEYNASLASTTPNRQSNWLGVTALPQQKRDSFFTYAEQELSDRIKLYGEGFYSKREFIRQAAAPTPTVTTVPVTNFYNQTGLAIPYAYSFINDLGPIQTNGSETTKQATLGLKFDLGHQWQTEGYYSYGRTDSRTHANNQINTAALTAALADSTAAAFDPFGSSRFTSQSTLNSIAGVSDATNQLTLKNAALKVDGPLFSLPGGDVRMAAGLEYMQDFRATTANNTSAGANINTVVTAPYQERTRKVDSAYAELLFPIIGANNALPLVKRLSFSVADRYDRYDDTNQGAALLKTSTTNPKFGFTWQVVDDLKLRGSYGTSFRAPSLGDYFYGAPTFAGVASAAAVPHAPGLVTPPGPVAAILIQGGRIDGVLTPETAKTWTLGADFTPASVPGLNLGLTYYNIKYENQIQTAATNTSFTNPAYANALIAAGLAVANPTTAQVQAFYNLGSAYATPTGLPLAILYGSGSTPVGPQNTPIYLLIDSRSVNSGQTLTSGWDFTLRYSMKTMTGNWTFADTFTYVNELKQSLLPGTPLIGYSNTYGYPLRFATRVQIGWEKNGLSSNVFINYSNGYTNTQVSPNVAISSYTTVDASVSYDTGSANVPYGLANVRVQLSAQNLLDRKPPFALVGNPAQTFDTQNASAVGRLLALTVEKKF